MLLAVRGQTHQAGLHGFVLLSNADVTTYILGSRVVVVRGRRGRWEGLAVALDGGLARASHASRGGPLVVGDPALRAHVRACLVGMVPVGLQAHGAEDVATWDGHGVPEVLLTEVAVFLFG